MIEALTTPGFAQADFDAFLADRREPAWLDELRREAWAAFLELPLPDRTQEEWMRTDIRGFKLDKFGIPAGRSAAVPAAFSGQDARAPGLGMGLKPPPAALLTEGVELSGTAVTLDACPVQTRLNPELQRRGVLFGSLEGLIDRHGETIRPYFLKAVDYRTDKFAALHAACTSGGAVLYVPKGVAIERPLHILSALSAGTVDFTHTLLILDEGAEATVLSETAGPAAAGPHTAEPPSAGLHCGAIEIFVGPQSGCGT